MPQQVVGEKTGLGYTSGFRSFPPGSAESALTGGCAGQDNFFPSLKNVAKNVIAPSSVASTLLGRDHLPKGGGRSVSSEPRKYSCDTSTA